MFDGEAFGAEVVAQVRGFVEKATADLRKEIEGLKGELDELKARAPEPGEKGDPGERGADGPAGEPGRDAPAPTMEQVEAAVLKALEPSEGVANPIAVQVQRWLEAFTPPQGEKGDAGERGAPGANGADGHDGADGRDAAPVTDEQVDAAVQRHLEANPVKTVTADDLAPIVAAQVSKAVAAIPAAKDGQDAAQIAGFVKNHEGVLVVTMTDGRIIETGIRDGAKGDAGRDGLTLTDFDTELSEDGRILTLSLENDEIKVRHELQLPVMIYRRVYREGETYLQGDVVTFGGSIWHCNATTTDKPDSGSEAWTLAAKRGRDGKDAKP